MEHTHTTKHIVHPTQRLAFVVTSILIAVFFLVSIVMVLTGKLRPSASVVTTTSRVAMRKAVTLSGGKMTYKYSGSSQTANGNDASVTIKSPLLASLPLQGLTDRLGAVPEINGKITVVKNGGNLNSNNDIAVRRLDWASTDNFDGSHRKLSIKSDSIVDRIESLNTNLDVIVKPKYYLATAVRNISNLDQRVNFSQIPAGDLNDDNTVNGADFAVLVSDFRKSVNNDNRFKDLNRNDAIGGDDFAILVSNYKKSGVDF